MCLTDQCAWSFCAVPLPNIFLFVSSSLGSGCSASHFRSLRHGKWAENSPTINHTEHTGLPPTPQRAPLPFFSLPSPHNCIVLWWQSVNDQYGEGDAELMAAAGGKEEEGQGSLTVWDRFITSWELGNRQTLPHSYDLSGTRSHYIMGVL